MRKKAIFAICTVMLFLFAGYTLFLVSKSRTYQFFGTIVSSVDTNEKVVALTFDDAPTEYTEEVLNTLQGKQVKATFYVIGQSLEKLPDTGKRIVSMGHELGNHSYSHQRFYLKSQSFIDKEIQKTNSLIREAGFTGDITFRAPNGKKLFGLPWYLMRHNIVSVTFDVEPDTFAGKLTDEKKTEFLVKYTLDHVKPGSVLLLHPFCSSCTSDRKAIGQVVEGLRERGYSFVTVSELLMKSK